MGRRRRGSEKKKEENKKKTQRNTKKQEENKTKHEEKNNKQTENKNKPAPQQAELDLERLKSQLKLELLEELSAGRSQGPGVPADWEEKTLKEEITPALRTFELKGYFRPRMDYMRNLDLGTAQFNRTRGGWDGSSNVPPALFWQNGDTLIFIKKH